MGVLIRLHFIASQLLISIDQLKLLYVVYFLVETYFFRNFRLQSNHLYKISSKVDYDFMVAVGLT